MAAARVESMVALLRKPRELIKVCAIGCVAFGEIDSVEKIVPATPLSRLIECQMAVGQVQDPRLTLRGTVPEEGR